MLERTLNRRKNPIYEAELLPYELKAKSVNRKTFGRFAIFGNIRKILDLFVIYELINNVDRVSSRYAFTETYVQLKFSIKKYRRNLK